MSISFDDARKLLRNHQINSEISDKLREFGMDVDEVATKLFRNKNSSYIMDFVSLIQAISMSNLLMLEEFDGDEKEFLSLLLDKKFLLYVNLCIKLSLGLAVMEELH